MYKYLKKKITCLGDLERGADRTRIKDTYHWYRWGVQVELDVYDSYNWCGGETS